MAEPSEIRKAMIAAVGANPNLPITAIVQTVEHETCSIKLKSGLVCTDVKLKASVTESENFIKLVPKVGSTVLVLSLSGDINNLAVIKVDEVEKVVFSQDGLEVLIDSTDKKVSIKNESVSLVDVFADLATLLKQFKVATPAGPSGAVLPPTIESIEQLETKFNQLLK